MDQSYQIQSIQLNSSLRNSGTLSSSEFNISPNMNNVKGIKLKHLMLPLNVSTIDSRNNKLYYILNTSAGSTTISSSNYTGSVFASTIETALRAGTIVDNSWTCTYNSNANLITIGATTASFQITTGSNSINYEAGLISNVGAAAATSLTSGSIDLSGIKMLNIASNIGGISIVNSNQKMLASIPIEEANLSISTYTDFSNDYTSINFDVLSTVNLSFYDHRMRPLTIPSDYSITLNLLID